MKKLPSFAKQISTFSLGAIILYFSLAFMILANIGLTPYDSAILTLGYLFNIEYGYACMAAGSIMLLTHILILRKKFPVRELLQLVIIFGGGFLMNFFVYDLLAEIVLGSLFLRIIIFTAMVPLVAFGCLIIMNADLMSTPLEGLALTIAKKLHSTLGIVRWIADGIFLVVSIVLTLIFKLDWTIGIGTAIGLILFSPLLDILKRPTLRFLRFLHMRTSFTKLEKATKIG